MNHSISSLSELFDDLVSAQIIIVILVSKPSKTCWRPKVKASVIHYFFWFRQRAITLALTGDHPRIIAPDSIVNHAPIPEGEVFGLVPGIGEGLPKGIFFCFLIGSISYDIRDFEPTR